MSQVVTVNVHNPIVHAIDRIHDDGLVLALSNGNEYHGLVHVFFANDAKLDAFLASVRDARPSPADYTCSYCKRPELDCSIDACAGVKKDREQ